LSRELALAVEAACQELGVDVRKVRQPRDADGVEILLGISYPEAYPALVDGTVGARRVAWIGEPLPPRDERLGDLVLRRVPMGRILDLCLSMWAATRAKPSSRLRRWREAAAYAYDRRVNLRAHRRAAKAGITIVVTSRDRAASLSRYGIVAPVVPYGYHAAFAGTPCDPGSGTRDIDVLFLGTAATGVPTRRARIAAQVFTELGVSVRTVIVEDGLWGAKRTALLQRAKVVLNVHRAPGNFEGIRSILAAAAGALVVSEPVDDPHPFVPGIHFVDAPAEELAAKTLSYLRDNEQRIAIARSLQDFVVTEVTMRRSVARLLEAVS
jgi:hypothetical protein